MKEDRRGRLEYADQSYTSPQAGQIITVRIIMIIAAQIVSQIGGYYEARPCEQIEYILGSPSATLSAYPDCAPYLDGSDPAKQVAVEANYSGSAVQLTVALGSNFGAAGWLAFALHAIGVEIYVSVCRTVSSNAQVDTNCYGNYSSDSRPPSRKGFETCRINASSKLG